MNRKTGFVIVAVVIAIIAVYAATRGHLTLDSLREQQARLSMLLEARPLASALAYFGIYVVVTALSVPGAAVMTLAGGALFGLWWGTVLVSFASSLGATLAFLIARVVCRSLVRDRFGERLERVRRGFDEDGAFYLFSLRLVPVIPFFVVNLVMALTSIRTMTFFLVSQAGMLPATLVYVNAGTQLASVESVSDVLSPSLVISFALLAVFPWIARLLLRAARKS